MRRGLGGGALAPHSPIQYAVSGLISPVFTVIIYNHTVSDCDFTQLIIICFKNEHHFTLSRGQKLQCCCHSSADAAVPHYHCRLQSCVVKSHNDCSCTTQHNDDTSGEACGKSSHYLIVTLTMTMSSCGLSVRLFALALEIFCTTSMPFVTLPNTVCLLSSHGCQPNTNTNTTHLHSIRNIILVIKLLWEK